MIRILATSFLSAALLASGATAAGNLKVTIDGIENGHYPKDAVACVPDGHGQYARTGHNVSPRISWAAGPAGTRSYALLMTDPDVPADMSQLNKAGATVPATAPRQLLYHWVLINIPADRTHVSAGEGNVFAQIFGMPKGNGHGEGLLFYQGGYGGPCPPWNDMRAHRYHIRIYALDTDSLALTQPFTGKQFEAAIAGHVLADGEATASYATNAALGVGY